MNLTIVFNTIIFIIVTIIINLFIYILLNKSVIKNVSTEMAIIDKLKKTPIVNNEKEENISNRKLNNSNNICFMNSIIQCLNNENVKNIINRKCGDTNIKIVNKLKIYLNYNNQENYNNFVKEFILSYPKYKNCQQEDMAEFLLLLLNILNIDDFKGEYHYSKKCLTCATVTKKTDIFYIRNYFERTEENIKLYCEKCNKNTDFLLTTEIKDPSISFLYINQDDVKKLTKTIFNDNLEGLVKYFQYGEASGHYLSYAKVNKKWYLFNDIIINKVEEIDLNNINLLMYVNY